MKNFDVNIEVHGLVITKKYSDEDMRALGVNITLNVDWSGQFKKVRRKLSDTIIKLMRMDMIAW